MNKLFVPVFLLLLISGCEKTINFDLKQVEPVLVVDANIENDLPPNVILSNSLNYFDNIDTVLLNNLFVHDADVFMSNGVVTHKLKEYAVPIPTSGVTLYTYSIDSADLATAFTGQLNTTYTLRIVADGKEYNATKKEAP